MYDVAGIAGSRVGAVTSDLWSYMTKSWSGENIRQERKREKGLFTTPSTVIFINRCAGVYAVIVTANFGIEFFHAYWAHAMAELGQ